MNGTMKSTADLWGLGIIFTAAIVAWRWKEHRLAVLLTGVLLMVMLGVAQFLRSRKRKLPRRKKSPVSSQQIGQVSFLSGRVFVSDKWEFARGELLDTAAGTYEVMVTIDSDEMVVTSIAFRGPADETGTNFDLHLSVDTGVAVIIDSTAEPDGVTTKAVQQITTRLLKRNDEEAPGAALIPDKAGIARGVVVETGWGDGIYTFQRRQIGGRTEITASFE